MQAYVGDGTDASSVFSAEGNRLCVGTPRASLPSAPPTKPDLAVTRVTGPTQVSDGVTAVYDIVLANEGTAAKGTAQVTINALGSLELVEMVETAGEFDCGLGESGFSCTGSLGGVENPFQERVAIFKVQVRGNGSGSATVSGSANHDGSLDEMTGDNNRKLLTVAVK